MGGTDAVSAAAGVPREQAVHGAQDFFLPGISFLLRAERVWYVRVGCVLVRGGEGRGRAGQRLNIRRLV